MPKKKGGLGRGLAELLGDNRRSDEAERGRGGKASAPREERAGAAGGNDTVPGQGVREVPATGSSARPAHEPEMGVIHDLPVASIRPNPRQPRRKMDREGLEELASSIEASGIVQPIIVRPEDGGYELIAGERRWRAAQMAGHTVVPAILRQVSDTESLEISLIENVVRQELNPVDEALALHVLMEDLGVTQEGLSARVGKSRSAIANKLRLLELPAEIQEILAEGELTEGHARAMLGLESRGDRIRLARRAKAEGMSVRAVEAEVRRKNLPRADRPAPRKPDQQLLDQTAERFYAWLEVVPRVRMTAKGGRVEIPFQDEAELRRLLDRLGE